MTQRIHNLVKHALAGFDVQLLRGRIRRRMRLGVGKSVAHEFLFPMQRFDLQLLESLRIGIADALLQSSDALGVLVDYHQNRTAILWRDRKLASSKVTIITPDAMKISSSRIGNGAPPAM